MALSLNVYNYPQLHATPTAQPDVHSMIYRTVLLETMK